MRIRASIVVLLLSTATLTACAGTAASAPSPSGSSSAAPVASPPLTPTPTADADDPSTWVITDDGMGSIELGAPFPVALSLMPEGTTNDTASCGWTAWWNAPGQSSQLYIARAADAADDGPVQNVTTASWTDPVQSSGPRTAEGIGVGSTVDEVQAAYPDATVVPDSVDSTIVHLQVDRMFFTYREDPVIASVTVTTAEVPPYELCG